MSQKEHLHEIPTHIGTITVIGTVRKNRPAGLRKPYEYSLSIKDSEALVKEMRAGIKGVRGFQCAGVGKKGLARGIKLDFFLLGYRPGLCGDDEEGVSREVYGKTVGALQQALTKYLGKDARVYAEPYSLKKKFEARFETYIQFSEMV